ncbi:MAG TPA: GAF domain-containing protein [Sphingomicrobium sp.]|nr:GAF domain-containing protein [Sphingomicrobium sp.]
MNAQSLLLHEVARADRHASKLALRFRRAKILAETAARLLSGADPDREVMPLLYRALSGERIIDATLGFVVVGLDRPLELGFMEGFDEEMVRRCVRLDFGQAICGTVAATRQAMHVTGIQRSLDPLADLVRSAGIDAYACEPLIVGQRLLGTLSFATRSRRSFDPEDLIFFRDIAKHLAVARDRQARRLMPDRTPVEG